MPEAPDARRQPSLFAQIAVRLVVLAVVFALLDIGLVVADYARDEQGMAEDFVGQQAGRIERDWLSSSASRPPPPPPVAPPAGATRWGYVVVDGSLRTVARGGDATLFAPPAWPTASVVDWTRRDRAPSGVRITGLRRFDGPAGPCWILIGVETRSGVVYRSVIAGELVDHVAVPLAALTVLLLVFNIAVVRRMLGPLTAAARQVDALDAGRMDARLSEPVASREVVALVAAVNRALDRLHLAMRRLRDFTADAAQELRTPLSILRLRIEALPDGDAKAELKADVLAMSRLTNQMLDLGQADALTLDDAVTVDLAGLARALVAQAAPLAFSAGLDIRLIDHGATSILGHPDALGRALRNLIDNAITHGGTGRGMIDVTVGPGRRISVRDHGEGLTTTEPGEIFRRFWRKRRDRGGAGLGLGIVRAIIEAHGGTIVAGNAPDGGAVFVCAFPEPPAPAPA